MLKIRNRKGFTLAEVLLVVAIVSALVGVSFVAVQRYNRSMTKLKYDGYARELFIAAQNHLALSDSLGYPGFDPDSDGEAKLGRQDADDDKIRYFVVNVVGGTSVLNTDTMLNQMLPTASVEDFVRVSGQYIIRYQLKEAAVREVFYWESSGRYALAYSDADYAGLVRTRGIKSALMNYGDKRAVVGYYNGEAAGTLETGDSLLAPELTVTNMERLTATVTDPNVDSLYPAHYLNLIVKGTTSGAEKVFRLRDDDPRVTKTTNVDGVTTYTIVLDDITEDGMGFSDIRADHEEFIPGENITLQVLAEPIDTLTAPAYSGLATTNSLFGELDTVVSESGGQAGISNIRHLENLDKRVSDVNDADSPIQFSKAKQTADISWTDFADALGKDPDDVQIRYGEGEKTNAGSFLPVTPGYPLEYDGNPTVNAEGETVRRKISDINVNTDGNAGLFGSLDDGSQVHDLELVDFKVNGSNAGALAGTTNGTAVTNVAAYNSEDKDSATTPTITGSGDVGGLIGSVTGGSVTGSAAALVVESTGTSGNAGGLIGTASSTEINGCYSGGHTQDGAYHTDDPADGELINVRGNGSVGGLVGSANNSDIQNSYSTCSAQGDTVGGLVGSSSGTEASIDNCYSVGLVRGKTEDSTVGVFAGSSTTACTNCAYLDIASYYDPAYSPDTALPAVGAGVTGDVTAMDSDMDTFASWTPQSAPAQPYDDTLATNYAGHYEYKTVEQLNSALQYNDFHIGDWPSPALLVVNT